MSEVLLSAAIKTYAKDAGTIERLLDGIVSGRRQYGPEVYEIYCFYDEFDDLQLCYCQFPGEDRAVLESPFPKRRRLIWAYGSPRPFPRYLRKEFNHLVYGARRPRPPVRLRAVSRWLSSFRWRFTAGLLYSLLTTSVFVFWSFMGRGFASYWMAALALIFSAVAANFLRCLWRVDDPESDELQQAGGWYVLVGFVAVLTSAVHPFAKWWEAILMALMWAFGALVVLFMTREAWHEIVSSARRTPLSRP